MEGNGEYHDDAEEGAAGEMGREWRQWKLGAERRRR
jgi:hypothetical protein